MLSRFSFLHLCIVCPFLACISLATGQTAGRTDPGGHPYAAHGRTDQPFTVQVVGARRTVANILLVKLSLTNNGTAPLSPGQDFAGDPNPADHNKISALYAVDPNGHRKYPVIRDPGNVALCSTIDPPVRPGERRMLYAQLSAPPDTADAFDLFFPKADPIPGIPTGFPKAGQPGVPVGADVANHSDPPSPALKGVGTVQSANTTVPFTVDVLGLHAPKGGLSVLKLALTNNGSGDLVAAGQFTGGAVDGADSQLISGVYLVDPVSKRRFEVARDAQGLVAAGKINPALGPGERRVLEARFPAIPATLKSVSVSFPHCTAITDVPVTR